MVPLREVFGEEMSRCRSVGIDALSQPSADDLGQIRVVVMRPVDAIARDLIVEIGIGVGVRRRGQADRRGDGGAYPQTLLPS